MAIERKTALRGENWSPRLRDWRKLFFPCLTCKNEWSVGNSPSRLKKASGFCKSCAAVRTHKAMPFAALYKRLKRQAGYRSLSVLLTFEEFLLFTKIPECHYCEVVLKWAPHGDGCPNLDRKDNDLGYTAANCVACCGMCNEIKGDSLTYEEMLLLAPVLRKIINLRKSSLSVFTNVDGLTE